MLGFLKAPEPTTAIRCRHGGLRQPQPITLARPLSQPISLGLPGDTLNKTGGWSHIILLLAGSQAIHDNPDFFDAIANIYAAVRDRIEEVIGRGNFKWLVLILLVLLAVWYVRRQRLSSL